MREILNEILRDELGSEKEVALSFSGGTDSQCLLYSLMDLGIRPRLYTYAVQGYPSQDLTMARKIADRYTLNLEVCLISNDLDQAHRDIMTLIGYGVRGKVALQCMHGHLYVAPRVKERTIFNGSGVDGLYGVYKKIVMKVYRNPLLFNDLRLKHLNNSNDDAMIDQKNLYARYGVGVKFPYRDPRFVETLMKLTWAEINKPRNKWITVKDYPEIMEHREYRPRGSQQINAGTRTLHEGFLHSPYNSGNHYRVDEIYKDWQP